MDNKEKSLDIYLMGIGGTGMGAFAGLLKQKGHRVSGSDSKVFSPMKEKLNDWGISYRTPYDADNLPDHCDLVIVGNVIRAENPEAQAMIARGLSYDSFPAALNKLFLKQAIPIVASGTHGKTTCSALLAHTLFNARRDPGFLIGGILCNFGESFRGSCQKGAPFVVEGDEYDTAYFDKRPKFIHYDPKFLLVTSLEFDHGDIYQDVHAVVDAFASLMKTLDSHDVLVINGNDNNIKQAIRQSSCQARLLTYGESCDFAAVDQRLDDQGIHFTVKFGEKTLGDVDVPLFGEHNLKNALGCYAILHQFGLSHQEISDGFKTFLGVKRRLEEYFRRQGKVVVDDFAHHPSAVLATIKAARFKYPHHKICAIFEPRSATSCMKIFEQSYESAFLSADRVVIAPVGRTLPEAERIDTAKIAEVLRLRGVPALAFFNYKDLEYHLATAKDEEVWLFMSNGDFHGLLSRVGELIM